MSSSMWDMCLLGVDCNRSMFDSTFSNVNIVAASAK